MKLPDALVLLALAVAIAAVVLISAFEYHSVTDEFNRELTVHALASQERSCAMGQLVVAEVRDITGREPTVEIRRLLAQTCAYHRP